MDTDVGLFEVSENDDEGLSLRNCSFFNITLFDFWVIYRYAQLAHGLPAEGARGDQTVLSHPYESQYYIKYTWFKRITP